MASVWRRIDYEGGHMNSFLNSSNEVFCGSMQISVDKLDREVFGFLLASLLA